MLCFGLVLVTALVLDLADDEINTGVSRFGGAAVSGVDERRSGTNFGLERERAGRRSRSRSERTGERSTGRLGPRSGFGPRLGCFDSACRGERRGADCLGPGRGASAGAWSEWAAGDSAQARWCWSVSVRWCGLGLVERTEWAGCPGPAKVERGARWEAERAGRLGPAETALGRTGWLGVEPKQAGRVDSARAVDGDLIGAGMVVLLRLGLKCFGPGVVQ